MTERFRTIMLLLLLAAAPGSAQSPLLQLSVGFANTVKEQQYSSARVMIAYEGPAKQCRLVVHATDGATASSVAEQEVALSGKARKRIEVPLFAETGTTEVVAELLEGAQVLARQSQKITRIDANDRLVVALAAGSTGVESIRGEVAAVPNNVQSYGRRGSQAAASRPQSATVESWDDLPALPLGWRALDAFVLVGAPPRAVPVEQQRALERWLQGGGTLIVSPGDDSRGLSASFLAPWLPRRLSGAMKQANLRSLQLFSGAQELRGEALVAVLSDRPGPTGEESLVLNDADTALVAQRGRGRGQIVLLTFNPTREPFAGWEGRKAFWSALLRWTLEPRHPWYASNQYEWRLRELMHRMKVVAVPPRALLLAPIIGYGLALIVVGLGMARVAGRKEKIWLVLCAMALAFSLGFYAVFRGKVHARATLLGIAITDVTPGAQTARTMMVMEAFSPAQRYLDMTVNAPNARILMNEGYSYMPFSTSTRDAIRTFTRTTSQLTGDLLQPWNLTQIVARFEQPSDHSFELQEGKPDLNNQSQTYRFSNRDRLPLRLARLNGRSGATVKMNNVAPGTNVNTTLKLSGAFRNIAALSQLPAKRTEREQRDQIAEWLMDLINQEWRSSDEEPEHAGTVIGLTDHPAPAVTMPGFRQEWYHFIRVLPASAPEATESASRRYRPSGLGGAIWASSNARTIMNSYDNTPQIGVGEAIFEMTRGYQGPRMRRLSPAGVPPTAEEGTWTLAVSGEAIGSADLTYAAYNWKTGNWNEWRPTKGGANATSPSLDKEYFFNEKARIRLTIKGSTQDALHLKGMDWAHGSDQ